MANFYHVNGSLLYLQDETGNGEFYSYTDLEKAFSETLKELREIYNLSGNALAGILGIPQQTLNLYENNKRTPNFVLAMQIASAFGITLEQMILNGLDLLAPDLETITHYPTQLPVK